MLTLSVLLHLALLLPPALRPIANKPRCSAVRLIAPLPERQKSAYGAEQITVLEGLEPVRKRPGMWQHRTATPSQFWQQNYSKQRFSVTVPHLQIHF